MSLPDDITQKLKNHRGTGSPQFYALVLAAHNAGWSFEAIGTALGVTRSAVNQWHKRALKKGIQPDDSLISPPQVKLHGTPRKIRIDVPSSERTHLLATAQQARRNKRWSASNSPERRAADEFEALIRYHVIERGVAVARFAKRAGVTPRAIAQRIEKMREQ